MRKKVILLFLTVSFYCSSQNKEVLYNFTPQPQSLLLNPGADVKYKWFFGVPLLSGISVNAGSTDFDVYDLFANDGVDFSTKVENLVASTSRNDYITANQQLEIFTGGFRVGGEESKSYVSFGMYQELDSFLYIPKDLALLSLYGNNDYIGKSFDLGDLSVKMELLTVFHVGFNKQLNKQLTLGIRGKIYSSIFNGTSTHNSGYFYTANGSDLIYDQAIDSNIEINTSGGAKYLDEDYEGDVGSDMKNDIPKKAFFGGNLGLGLDLGLTYYPQKNIQLTTSLVDIGFIKHSKDVVDYTLKGDHVLTGVLPNIFNNGSVDNLEDVIPFETIYDDYTTWRPVKFYSSFQYSFEEAREEECDCLSDEDSWYRSAVGAQFFAMTTPRNPMVALTGYYRRRILKALQMKATYTLDSYSFSNVGLGLTTKIGIVNFYAMANNLLAYSDLSKANALTFQIGFNIISGGSNKL